MIKIYKNKHIIIFNNDCTLVMSRQVYYTTWSASSVVNNNNVLSPAYQYNFITYYKETMFQK